MFDIKMSLEDARIMVELKYGQPRATLEYASGLPPAVVKKVILEYVGVEFGARNHFHLLGILQCKGNSPAVDKVIAMINPLLAYHHCIHG